MSTTITTSAQIKREKLLEQKIKDLEGENYILQLQLQNAKAALVSKQAEYGMLQTNLVLNSKEDDSNAKELKLQKQLYDNLYQQYQDLSQKLITRAGEAAALKSLSASNQQHADEMQQQYSEQSIQLSNVEAQVRDLKHEVQIAQQQKAQAIQHVKELEEQLIEKQQAMTNTVAELKHALVQAKNEVSNKETALNLLRVDIKHLQAKCDRLTEHKKIEQQACDQHSQELSELKRQVFDLQQQLQQKDVIAHDELSTNERKITDKENIIRNLEQQIHELQEKLNKQRIKHTHKIQQEKENNTLLARISELEHELDEKKRLINTLESKLLTKSATTSTSASSNGDDSVHQLQITPIIDALNALKREVSELSITCNHNTSINRELEQFLKTQSSPSATHARLPEHVEHLVHDTKITSVVDAINTLEREVSRLTTVCSHTVDISDALEQLMKRIDDGMRDGIFGPHIFDLHHMHGIVNLLLTILCTVLIVLRFVRQDKVLHKLKEDGKMLTKTTNSTVTNSKK